jgi:hypothetical protein
LKFCRSQRQDSAIAASALVTRPAQKKKPWFMPSQREVIAGVPAPRSFSA